MPDSLNLADAANDDETFDPIAFALAHADNISHPIVRSLFNYIATKISTLPEAKIRRLSDDQIARLIQDETIRLPEAELNRLLDAEFARLIAIADSLFRFLSGPNPKADKENGATAIENFATEIVKDFLDSLFGPVITILGQLVLFVVLFVVGGTGFIIISLIGQVLYPESPASRYVTTNEAQKERLRSLKRSNFLSKYSRMPDLKGLKGIGEIYSREIYKDSRQDWCIE
ncbi:uncharacterized protein LOC131650807 isoform X2 [Vicia villosa]|uniref:uncharacterized protein LOC131650807 isoform X2 n=1 Tax=Vicia villosa TaxID=3911 RepID=UPI00273BBD7D|nr:uncharacterized protein LOC131650807 isoform X2 [Vicia villosa]